ncbi:hypothetical protein KEM54_005058, partial [Ascosphaera aggregata]
MDASAFIQNTTPFDSKVSDPLPQPRVAMDLHLGTGQLQPPMSEPSGAAASGGSLQLTQPEVHDAEEPIPFEGPGLPKAAWDVSLQDRNKFVAMLERYSHVLPSGFMPPTRHGVNQ